MSDVTNLILACSVVESDPIERVNAFFGDGYGFITVPDTAVGGTKNLETRLAIGAFNRLQLPALVDFIRQLAWQREEVVQLIAQEQEELRFKIIQPFETDMGNLVGQEFEAHVVKRRQDLVFRECGPFGYEPIPDGGFGGLEWKDRPRVRVKAVDHVAREMLVEVL